jgi:hypothetical protein
VVNAANPLQKSSVIVLAVPRRRRTFFGHSEATTSGFTKNLEFLWSSDSIANFGTVGLSFDWTFLRQLPNWQTYRNV